MGSKNYSIRVVYCMSNAELREATTGTFNELISRGLEFSAEPHKGMVFDTSVRVFVDYRNTSTGYSPALNDDNIRFKKALDKIVQDRERISS